MKEIKNIILTGATGGLGAEILSILIKKRFNVVISSRNEEDLVELKNGLNGGRNIFPLAFNFSHLSKVDEFVEKASAFLGGRVDVLINNAGIGYHSKIENIVLKELEEVFYVNSIGPIILTSKLLPALRKSKNPHVINISSFLGEKVMNYAVAYAATKHAINGFSKGLRLEEATNNIKVTIIEPGAIDTNFVERTHDVEAKEIFQKRKIKKMSPVYIAGWVEKIIDSNKFVCPEVLRIAPTEQVI